MSYFYTFIDVYQKSNLTITNKLILFLFEIFKKYIEFEFLQLLKIFTFFCQRDTTILPEHMVQVS